MDTKATKYGYSWAAYKAIEEDMLRVAEYIPLETRQYDVYSFKLADIIMRSCSHIDSLLKDVIRNQDLSDHPNQQKIAQCRSIIQNPKRRMVKFTDYIEIFSEYWNLDPIEVTIRRNDDIKRPFAEFENPDPQRKTPTWWRAYNALKHDFYSEVEKGTLENALLSLSALFILNCIIPLHFKLEENINYLLRNRVITSPNFIHADDLLEYFKEDPDLSNFSLLAETDLFRYWLKYNEKTIGEIFVRKLSVDYSMRIPAEGEFD